MWLFYLFYFGGGELFMDTVCLVVSRDGCFGQLSTKSFLSLLQRGKPPVVDTLRDRVLSYLIWNLDTSILVCLVWGQYLDQKFFVHND